MHIPRIQSNLAPLLVTSLSPLPLIIVETPVVENPKWIVAYRWALRFSLHLTLISLFETIFFWTFVSESEDTALVSLVNGYTQGVMNSCANLTESQRSVARDIVDLFINPAATDAAGIAAFNTRSAFNSLLVRNSWLYFGSLLTLFTGLALVGRIRQYKTEWSTLIAENIALVTFLGFYEWMFFSTVVLKYQAISMPELDRMVVDEFQLQC